MNADTGTNKKAGDYQPGHDFHKTAHLHLWTKVKIISFYIYFIIYRYFIIL